jgi:predicted DNA-binding transcriptional regulator AlpA
MPEHQPVRLLFKNELLKIVPYSYSTIWDLMNKGKFPRSRKLGGKAVWLADEVEEFLRNLPPRPLKCDKPLKATIKRTRKSR